MDLSKLPRLSETDKHAPGPADPQSFPQPAPQPMSPPAYDPAPGGGVAAQVWLSLILGLVFMMMGWNFARFMGAKLTGQAFHTNVNWMSGPKAGTEVDYFELDGYTAYTDTSVFLFGLAMVLEGVVLLAARKNTKGSRILVAAALGLTVGMVVFNVIVAGMLFSTGVMPILSILVIAFGGWMAMFEWQLFQQMKAIPMSA